MDAEKLTKSTQEQAVASWVNYLNQVRLSRLLEALAKEQTNLESAMATLQQALETIKEDIVYNGMGRGGQSGMHGFIAEVAECGIGNARSQIEGGLPVYEWINDNGPEDLRRGTVLIQQKFVQSGNHLSLQAIRMHLAKYPEFLAQGGKYQIPADHYEKIRWLLSIPREKANKMPTANGEFSLRQWQEVQDFFASGEVPLGSIEPSILQYGEVQRGTFEQTFAAERKNLRKRNQERKAAAQEKSKPTLKEGVQATAVAMATEGGTAFCLAVAKKLKAGKKLKDFTADDWREIAADSGIGLAKGGIRGVTLYVLTNFTETPAALANAVVTASFGVAEQANKFRKGELDEQSFIENSELLCLDAAVCAVASLIGGALLPNVLLGPVIGNAVGTMLYQIAKDALSEREQQLFAEYANSVRELEGELASQYQSFVDAMAENMQQFMVLLDMAFSPDIRIAFAGSVELARSLGIADDEILDSKEKIAAYFLDE